MELIKESVKDNSSNSNNKSGKNKNLVKKLEQHLITLNINFHTLLGIYSDYLKNSDTQLQKRFQTEVEELFCEVSINILVISLDLIIEKWEIISQEKLNKLIKSQDNNILSPKQELKIINEAYLSFKDNVYYNGITNLSIKNSIILLIDIMEKISKSYKYLNILNSDNFSIFMSKIRKESVN